MEVKKEADSRGNRLGHDDIKGPESQYKTICSTSPHVIFLLPQVSFRTQFYHFFFTQDSSAIDKPHGRYDQDHVCYTGIVNFS